MFSFFRKTVMAQYATALDLTKVYEESFNVFGEALQQVEKEQEYVQFIKDHARYAHVHQCYMWYMYMYYLQCRTGLVTV